MDKSPIRIHVAGQRKPNSSGPSASRPRHQQIADELRQLIAAGTLQPGDPLPSEHALMHQFGVSRGTVRQARAALRADGSIGGSQGRKLVVRGAPLTQPLGELVSFTSWVRSLGKEPTGSGHLVRVRASASEEVAGRAGSQGRRFHPALGAGSIRRWRAASRRAHRLPRGDRRAVGGRRSRGTLRVRATRHAAA